MADLQVQQLLKNMSGDELARIQNSVITSTDLDAGQRLGAIALISNELAVRQNEPMLRKAERFLNRHGERVGMVAIGALLGVSLDE